MGAFNEAPASATSSYENVALVDFAQIAVALTGSTGARIELMGHEPASAGYEVESSQRHEILLDGHPVGSLVLFGTAYRKRGVDALMRQLGEFLRRDREFHDIQRRYEGDVSLAERSSEIARYAARRFESLFDSLPVACYACDQDGRLMEWNSAAETLWPSVLERAWGEDVALIVAPDAVAEERSMIARVLAGETITDRQRSLTQADGRVTWLAVAAFPLRDGRQRVVGALAAHLDITAQVDAQAELVERETRFRTAMEALHEGLAVVDGEGDLTYVNPSAERILGTSAGRLHLSTFNVDGHPIDPDWLPWTSPLRNGEPVREMLLGLVDGTWLSVNAEPLRGTEDRPKAVVVTFTNVTARIQQEIEIAEYGAVLEARTEELAQANAQLRRLATTDGLTGLSNHRTFQEALAKEFRLSHRSDRPLSLALLDVDHFKAFNDAHGHPAGDEVLREVAAALKATARASDVAARYGGEEFAILLPDTDVVGAWDAAERIRLAIADHPWAKDAVTASLGIATLEPADVDPSALVARADRALYAAKASGRNRTMMDGGPMSLAA